MAKSRSELIKLWLKEWPAVDRRALERALEEGDGCDFVSLDNIVETGLASHWGDDHRYNNVAYYSYWLRFLRATGNLDEREMPHERVTRSRLNAYVRKLERVSPQARLTYVRGVHNVLSVIAPNADQRYLKNLIRRLKSSATPTRDQREILVPPSDMFYAGLDRMNRTQMYAEEGDLASAMAYSDGLMMAMMACRALRKRNFTAMLLQENIFRNMTDEYEVLFSANQTKARKRIQAALSRKLTPYIDRWLAKIRPSLLQERLSHSMWITSTGSDMTAASFYKRFRTATKEEFGHAINPHAVRKMIATGVAIASPQDVQMVSALLDHTSDQSDAYDLADNLSASNAYLGHLEQRRKEAISRTFGTTKKRIGVGSMHRRMLSDR